MRPPTGDQEGESAWREETVRGSLPSVCNEHAFAPRAGPVHPYVGELLSVRRLSGLGCVGYQHLAVAAVYADAEDALGMADVVSAVERNSPPVRSPHGMRWPGAWPAEVSGNAMVVRAIRTRHLQAPAVSPGGEVGDMSPIG